MGLLYGRRVAEPEVMDETAEVEAYASAAASDHLSRLDSDCAKAILALGADPGRWLDLGCGPGQIACKVAARTSATIVAVDRASGMLLKARDSAAALRLTRLLPVQADAAALPFKAGAFELVYSNSVLHHLSQPRAFLEEAARVRGASGKFFLRDLVRPARWRMRRHLHSHGCNYSGEMRRLFEASVRAAYTITEARRLVKAASLAGATIRRERGLYLVIQSHGTVPRRAPATAVISE